MFICSTQLIAPLYRLTIRALLAVPELFDLFLGLGFDNKCSHARFDDWKYQIRALDSQSYGWNSDQVASTKDPITRLDVIDFIKVFLYELSCLTEGCPFKKGFMLYLI